MDLSGKARTVMEEVRDRFVASGFPNPWYWPINASDVGDAADELIRSGLLGRMESGSALHLTESGRAWVLESGGLVVVFCPKCSTDWYIAKGQREGRAVCTCGVSWTEDTTVVPFVPKY